MKARIVGRPSLLRVPLLALGVLLLHWGLLDALRLPGRPPAAHGPAPAMALRGVRTEAAHPPPTATPVHEAATAARGSGQPPLPAPRPAPRRSALALATPASAAAPGAPPAATELPVYATRLPPALHWRYALQRQNGSGSALLRWQPEGDHYEAELIAEAAGGAAFEWRSRGSLGDAGIAPARFLDRRRGRGAQAANFQRDSARITYSGPSIEAPLPAGAQDRLSWLLQLAGVVAAEPARWAPGQRLQLFVSGARGDAAVWAFEVQGLEAVDTADGSRATALKLLREPQRPYDTRVEVWLDPRRHYLPLRCRLGNGAHFTELLLQGEAP